MSPREPLRDIPPEQIEKDVRDLLLRGASQAYVQSLDHSLNYGHVSEAFRAGAEWERTRDRRAAILNCDHEFTDNCVICGVDAHEWFSRKPSDARPGGES